MSSVGILNYHFVWCPKYHKKILMGNVRDYLVKVLYAISCRYNFKIIALEVMPDHIHLFLRSYTTMPPAKIAYIFKRKSSMALFRKFPFLYDKYPKGHLWSPSYYCGTAGHVSSKTIEHYIRYCQKPARLVD